MYLSLDYNCPKSKVNKFIKINAGNSVTYNTNPDAGNTYVDLHYFYILIT